MELSFFKHQKNKSKILIKKSSQFPSWLSPHPTTKLSKMGFSFLIILIIITSSVFLIVSANPTAKKIPLDSNESSLESPPQDGVKSSMESSTTVSVGPTSVTDIRKLLEDYIQYLASLPDIRQDISNNLQDVPSQSSSLPPQQPADVISMAESNDEYIRPPITYHTIVPVSNPNQQHPGIFETSSGFGQPDYISETSTTAHSMDGYQEIPLDHGITLSLNKDELNTFIENVLGSIQQTRPKMSNNGRSLKISSGGTSSSHELLNANSTETKDYYENFNNETEVDDGTSINRNDEDIDDSFREIVPLNVDENETFVNMDEVFRRTPSTTTTTSTTTTSTTTTQAPPNALSNNDRLEIYGVTPATKNDKRNIIDNDPSTELSTAPPISSTTTESPSTTTVSPTIILVNQTDNGTIHENDIDSQLDRPDPRQNPYSVNDFPFLNLTSETTISPEEQEQPEEKEEQSQTEVTSDYLLDQLKHTKELLNIQIEKLKSLEKNVFRRKTTPDSLTVTRAISDQLTTTETPNISEHRKNESSNTMSHDIDSITTVSPFDLANIVLENSEFHQSTTTEPNKDQNLNDEIGSIPLTTTNRPSMSLLNDEQNVPEKELDKEVNLNSGSSSVPEFNEIDSNSNLYSSPELARMKLNGRLTTSSIEVEKSSEFVNDNISDRGRIIENDDTATGNGRNREKKGFPQENHLEKSLKDNQSNQAIVNGNLTEEINVTNISLAINSSVAPSSLPSSANSLSSLSESNFVSISSPLSGSDLNSSNYGNGNKNNEKDERKNGLSSSSTKSKKESIEEHDDHNNESNVETMILTHVPKITIIHKIMKPYRMVRNDALQNGNVNDNDAAASTNNNADDFGLDSTSSEEQQENRFLRLNKDDFADESLYREALRKHQELIRSTMSSMSLYPAAFKRYKINDGDDKVKSIDEIYLLPNFSPTKTTTTMANGTSSIMPTATDIDSLVIQVDNNNDEDNNNSNNQAIDINNNQTESSTINMMTTVMRNSNNQINNITTNTDNNRDNHYEKNNTSTTETINAEQKSPDHYHINDKIDDIRNNYNNNNKTKLIGSKTYSWPRRRSKKNNGQNKFNAPSVLELDLNNRQINGRNVPAKLLLNYHTILAFNRNPENIIKLYRPRFKNRKRFRKVRLPAGYRLRKDINGTTTAYMVTSANTAFSTNSTNEENSLITTTLDDGPDHYLYTTLAATLINDEKPTTTTTTVVETASPIPTTTLSPPAAQEMASETISIGDNQPLPTTTMAPDVVTHRFSITSDSSISEILDPVSSHQLNNNSGNKFKNFKIFCTFDAHRSLPLMMAEDEGRFFDINILEQNSAMLKQCTHLVYAFANIDLSGELYTGLSSIHQDVSLRGKNKELNSAQLIRLQKLKENNPHLKTLVAVGGWDTPPQLFSLMVATSKLRERLGSNIHKFILENGFDGALIAWFYPVYGMKSSLDSRSTRATGQSLYQLDDKQNLIRFVRSLKNKFDYISHPKLELGLMIPPFQEFIDRGFDAQKLANSLDHLILMTYDYYGSWENQIHHFAPLYPQKSSADERNQKFNINYTVNYWLNEKGAPRNKTSIGVAFYGRSFTLANQTQARIGSPASGPGIAGPVTNRPGLLAFNELCELYLGNPSVQLNEDEYHITANLQLFDQWVGFDDELSLYLKTKYAMGNNLSGIFIWSINYDDYRNRCGWGNFPLLRAVNKAVEHCTLWNQCGPMVISQNRTSTSTSNNSSSPMTVTNMTDIMTNSSSNL